MITLGLIAITVGISFYAFNNSKMMNDYLFLIHRINNQKEYFRFVSSGFIHADGMHLFFNMLALFSFGSHIEDFFSVIFTQYSSFAFLAFYLSAMVVSQIPSYIINKNNYHYASLGASGAVSAIVYASILINPFSTILVFFIPMPAVLFGVVYLILSYYFYVKKMFNWDHITHITGAIYGFCFPIFFEPSLLKYFLNQLGF